MLSTKARQALKGLAHDLKPVIHVGKKALSDTLYAEVDAALLAHELIKVKFNESAAKEQEEIASQLAEKLAADLVELRGHIATLYRKHPEKPKIKIKV